jgi:hypothetical protein
MDLKRLAVLLSCTGLLDLGAGVSVNADQWPLFLVCKAYNKTTRDRSVISGSDIVYRFKIDILEAEAAQWAPNEQVWVLDKSLYRVTLKGDWEIKLSGEDKALLIDRTTGSLTGAYLSMPVGGFSPFEIYLAGTCSPGQPWSIERKF